MGDALIDQLVHSPRLEMYMMRLNSVLADERGRRQRFYDEMDESIKQEFINGEVIVHSPTKWKHGEVREALATLLRTYALNRKVGRVGSEKTLISLTRNDYEPDICFFSVEKASRFKPHQMQFPAPDLAVEIL